MLERQLSPAQLELFKTRVIRIMRDLWDGYLERRQAAVDAGQPWDDAAERAKSAHVGGTALDVFDLTGDHLVSQWEWEGSDAELAENYVRDALSPFPSGLYHVPFAKVEAIVAMSDETFLAAREMARRRPIGPNDDPREGLAAC
jgi:hypothetical protein